MPDGRKPLRLENGSRVFSVDLGLRHGAAWAVWGLSTKAREYPGYPNPLATLEIGATDDGEVVYAHCLQRGLIDLPGEGENLPGESRALWERIRNLRRELNINRRLLWIAQKLTENKIDSIEFGDKIAKPRRNGKGFRLKRLIIRRKTPLTLEQQRLASDDAAEELGQLWDLEELGKWLSDKGCMRPNPEDASYTDQMTAFKEYVWSNRRGVAEFIFKPQTTVGNIPKKERSVAYKDNCLFWGRDLRFQGEVAVLCKEMRSKKRDRGGLSADRLSFLADFYDLLKVWTFRPRRPIEKRHMAKEQGFAIKDRDHLQAMKDDRIKKLSFLIVSRALGYETNLETGLWRYLDAGTGLELWQRPESGQFFSDGLGKVVVPVPKELGSEAAKRPHPVGPPCQLIVFEDLTRYKFRQDRSRQENSQLMKWSHREIFHFTHQMAQLYSLRVGMVYAAFSSQYCSCCGSAGARVARASEDWFPEGKPALWLQKMMDRKDANGHPTQEAGHLKNVKPGDWIAWKSGECFLCSDGACSHGKALVNADENAASNIGRRFLEGIRDFRLTVELDTDGKCVVIKPASLKGRQLIPDSNNGWVFEDEEMTKRAKKRVESDGKSLNEDEEELQEKRRLLFRNCSAGKRIWMEGGMFWGMVRNRVHEKIRLGKVKVPQTE